MWGVLLSVSVRYASCQLEGSFIKHGGCPPNARRCAPRCLSLALSHRQPVDIVAKLSGTPFDKITARFEYPPLSKITFVTNKSARESIGTKQNPECRCGWAGNFSICPYEKQNISWKTKNFFSSQFCTSLPTNFRGDCDKFAQSITQNNSLSIIL